MTATAVQLSRRGPAVQLAEADRSRGLVLDRAPCVCARVCACMCVCRGGQDAGGILSPDATAVEPCHPPFLPPPGPCQARHTVTSISPLLAPPCNNLSLIPSNEWRRAKAAASQAQNEICETCESVRVGGMGGSSAVQRLRAL